MLREHRETPGKLISGLRNKIVPQKPAALQTVAFPKRERLLPDLC